MGTVTELPPLLGFKYSSVADINDNGDVVGQSSGPLSPLQTYMRATLWKRDRTSGNFTPVPLSTSPNRSDALKVNEKGEILLVEYDGPLLTDNTPSRWLLWSAGQPLLDLATRFPGLQRALDVNDNTNGSTQVLAEFGSGQAFVGNPDGTTFSIPDVPLPGNRTVKPTLFGLDNAGRVGGWLGVPNPVPFPLGPPLPVYWIHPDAPPPGNGWNASGFASVNLPHLTKGGVILFQLEGADLSGVSHWYDLDDPGTIPESIKFVGFPGLHVYLDANEAGWIVGHEDWKAPTLYNSTTRIAEYLLDGSSGADPHSSSACAVNNESEIIGNGSVNGNTRGWILTGFKPLPPGGPKVAVASAVMVDPLYAMLGSTLYARIVELVHPHNPFEAFEGVADLVQLMSPTEKRQVLARVGLVRGYASALESQLEGGVGIAGGRS